MKRSIHAILSLLVLLLVLVGVPTLAGGPVYTPKAGGGGGAVPEYALYQGVPEEGLTPLDPAGLTDAGTGYTQATGRFVFVTSAAVTTEIGYQDQLARWSIQVTDLYPAWDPQTEQVDAYLNVVTQPAFSQRHGVGVGLLDAVGADYATSVGSMTAIGSVFDNAWFWYRIGPVGQTGFIALAAAVPSDIRNISLQIEGGNVMSSVYLNGAGVWTGGIGSIDAAPNGVPSDWYLHVILQADAVAVADPGETWTVELYTRIVPIGAIEP